ncbi:MAG: hypothetical protein KKA73_16565 [Chloroflexi bacterium]|nr:hypothetical protein [Chloroflexota bacterium]MBU1749299.1 hypothetical protein [Chloroflexota bacterium]
MGQRTRMAYGGNNNYYYYNGARGQLSQVRQRVDSVNYNTWYTYDSLSRIVTTKYPDNEVVTTGYDDRGLPNSLTGSTPYVSSTAYNAPGQVELRVLGNTRQVDYVYYPWTTPTGRGRVQQIQTGTTGDPTERQNLSYTYDAVGNVTQIVDGKAIETWTYAYRCNGLSRGSCCGLAQG